MHMSYDFPLAIKFWLTRKLIKFVSILKKKMYFWYFSPKRKDSFICFFVVVIIASNTIDARLEGQKVIHSIVSSHPGFLHM